MSKWTETIERYLQEGRGVSGGKNDSSKQAAEAQQTKNNKNMYKALATQDTYLGPVHSGLGEYLAGDVGFSPEQNTLLNSESLNQNSQQFNAAGTDVRAALGSRGSGTGDMPVGGDYTRVLSYLYGARGASLADALRQNRMADINQALTNKFNTANIFAGVGGMYGNQALGFGGLANQNISQIHQSFRPGFFENTANAFGGALGKSLGGGLGYGLTGGLGGLIYGSGGGSNTGSYGGSYSNG